MNFTPEQDEMLIDLTAKHPCLYNPRVLAYRDTSEKEKSWREIAKQLGKTVQQCRKRWKNIKDAHQRRIRKGKVNGSPSATYTRVYNIAQKLAFLPEPQNKKKPLTLDEIRAQIEGIPPVKDNDTEDELDLNYTVQKKRRLGKKKELDAQLLDVLKKEKGSDDSNQYGEANIPSKRSKRENILSDWNDDVDLFHARAIEEDALGNLVESDRNENSSGELGEPMLAYSNEPESDTDVIAPHTISRQNMCGAFDDIKDDVQFIPSPKKIINIVNVLSDAEEQYPVETASVDHDDPVRDTIDSVARQIDRGPGNESDDIIAMFPSGCERRNTSKRIVSDSEDDVIPASSRPRPKKKRAKTAIKNNVSPVITQPKQNTPENTSNCKDNNVDKTTPKNKPKKKKEDSVSKTECKPDISSMNALQTNTVLDMSDESLDGISPESFKTKQRKMIIHTLDENEEDVDLISSKILQGKILNMMNEPDDDIDLFFKSIVLSVKKLSPALIDEAKVKTLQVIVDLQNKDRKMEK